MIDPNLLKVCSRQQVVDIQMGVPLEEVLRNGDPIRLLGTEYEHYANWQIAMNAHRWIALLGVRPDMAKHCPWDEFTYDQLVYLVMNSPSLIEHVDVVRLDRDAWEMILCKHPHLLPFCDQDILGEEVKNVVRLVTKIKFDGDA